MAFHSFAYSDLRPSDVRAIAAELTGKRSFQQLALALDDHLKDVASSAEHELEQAFVLGGQIRTAIELRAKQSAAPELDLHVANYPAMVAFTYGYGGRSFSDALARIEKGLRH